jgi:FkbM family methyltransferase
MLPTSLRKLVRQLAPPQAVLWRQSRYARRYGEPELDLVPCLCDPTRDSVDVGANEGLYSNRMRRHSRRTFAFEAVTHLADELRWKFGNSVIVHNLAVSSKAGRGSINIPQLNGRCLAGLSTLNTEALDKHAEVKVQPVELCRLDDILVGDVGFIKIDVEGHERAVLQGATATVTRCRPNILVEAEERHSRGALDFLRLFFDEYRYAGSFVLNSELRFFRDFDPATMQNPRDIPKTTGRIDRKKYKRYVNNFIFIPIERAEFTTARIHAALGLIDTAPGSLRRRKLQLWGDQKI